MNPNGYPTDRRFGKYNLIDGFHLTEATDDGPGPSNRPSQYQENLTDFQSNFDLNERRNGMNREYQNKGKMNFGGTRRPNLEHLLLPDQPPDYSNPLTSEPPPLPPRGINDSFSYVPSVSGDWYEEENEASFTIEYMDIEPPPSFKPKSAENGQKIDNFDANETILASSGGIPDYSPMFKDLTRKLVEEERNRSLKMSFDERVRRLKEELEVVKEEERKKKELAVLSSSFTTYRAPILRRGSIRRPLRRKEPNSIHTIEYDTDTFDLLKVTPEVLENMEENELKQVTSSFFESNPRERFKEFYPFLVEGMIQKDYQTKDLKLFSSRLRNVRIPDARGQNQMSKDYVYFLVIRPGVYGGFWYETHPSCLISAKFRSQHETVLHGYALLVYPCGTKEDSLNEERWICWNDSLGLMNVNRRSAMQAMKKQPSWDKQSDVVTIYANSYNGRYVVDKIVAVTSIKEKKQHLPHEPFLITDAIFREQRRDDIVFYSNLLKSEILIKKDRIGNVEESLPYELIVVPTFSHPTTIEFRCLLIIQSTFWTEDKNWIRNAFAEKTNAYRS